MKKTKRTQSRRNSKHAHGVAAPRAPVTVAPKVAPGLISLRKQYDLSARLLARLFGVSEATLRSWEKHGPSNKEEHARVRRVKKILAAAAETMRPSYIASWLTRANPACAELGAAAPVDLMERGDYDAAEDLLFLLGSGLP